MTAAANIPMLPPHRTPAPPRTCSSPPQSCSPAPAPPATHAFSPQTLSLLRGAPGPCTLPSLDAGWRSLLLADRETSPTPDVLELPSIPDQQISLVTRGTSFFESFRSGRWHGTHKRVGTVIVHPPLFSARFRWQTKDDATGALLSLFLPATFFAEAAEEFRRAGTAAAPPPPAITVAQDSTISELLHALARAAAHGMPETYAETAGRFVATHLLTRSNSWPETTTARDLGADLTDRRLARVLDFLRHSFAEPLTTDQLARLAGISPFHFARLFKRKLGHTPHQHILRLRMEHAASLLRSTDRSVLEIAAACGYSNPSHFAAAFAGSRGSTPAAFRTQSHSRPQARTYTPTYA